MYSHFLNKSQN